MLVWVRRECLEHNERSRDVRSLGIKEVENGCHLRLVDVPQRSSWARYVTIDGEDRRRTRNNTVPPAMQLITNVVPEWCVVC